MGEHARRVQAHLRERLASLAPAHTWETEYDVGGTPVDIAGVPDADTGELVLLELEWRRADPVNNTAKLFRALVEGDGLASEHDRLGLVQAFTDYYALASGGVSTKRRNAVFVGERVARTAECASYDALTLALSPPTRGGALPDDWRDAVATLAEQVVRERAMTGGNEGESE